MFGVNNFLALRYYHLGLYFSALTGWYEAWALWAFFAFLERYLEQGHPCGSLHTLHVVTHHEDHKHIFPANACCWRWSMKNGEFVRRCKVGIIQYAIVETLCTTVTFATAYADKYGDGEVHTNAAYIYVTIAVNLSQVWALYVLVHFYHVLRVELAPIHPFTKCAAGCHFSEGIRKRNRS